MTDRVLQMINVHDEALELFKRKNADYGDAFATYGTVGVLVRLGDKIMRLQNISNRGVQLVDDEKLRDTLIDLHNYAAMAIMLLDENYNTNFESNSEYSNSQYSNSEYSNSNTPVNSPTRYNLSDEPILEDNEPYQDTAPQVVTWGFYGSTGNTYTRRQTRINGVVIKDECSCPSYQYSPDSNKTCKHIKNVFPTTPT